MSHALQVLKSERRRLADRWLELTRMMTIAPDSSVAGGVLLELIDETQRLLCAVDRAVAVLERAEADLSAPRKAA